MQSDCPLVMRKIFLVVLLQTVTINLAISQRVQWRSFSFTEENEFFNIFQHGIDRFYTQGLQFEFKYSVSRSRLFERLMIPLKGGSTNIYSLSIFQKIYTPGRTDLYDYVGDHPYVGTLFLSQGLDSYDSVKQSRLVSRLDAGVIGPAALAKNTQDLFHEVINNDPAIALNKELRNDIFLNYSMTIETDLTRHGKKFRIESKGEVNLGTALVSAIPGINFEYGPWYRSDRTFKWQLFFRPEVRVVAFNAMLQGGILNQAYADEAYSRFFLHRIKPLVYSHSTGIRLSYRRYQMLYRQVNLTREFTHQKPHYYSTVQFVFPLGGNN